MNFLHSTLEWTQTIVIFLVLISILVAAHEYGHFLFARLCGMDVEEFAIGMGKKLWTAFTKKGTEYNLRLLPIGGFVKIKGMIPQEDGSEVEVENGFYSKSPYKRFLVLFAGPLFSMIAGVLVLTVLFMSVGAIAKSPILGDVKPGDPADKAGLKEGDLVLSIDGTSMPGWVDTINYIHSRPNKQLTIVVKRGSETISKTLMSGESNEPMALWDSDGNPTGKKAIVGLIGVSPSDKVERLPPIAALEKALITPIDGARGLFHTFTHPAAFSETMGGPITIATVTHDASTTGTFGQRIYQVFSLGAYLSISLGLMNLLPIVPLDGGQIVIAIAEMFSRRRPSLKIQEMVGSVGFCLVATLIICILWVDFRRIGTPATEAPKVISPKTDAPPAKPVAPVKAVKKAS